MNDATPTLGDLVRAWWAYQRLAQGSREDRKRLSLGEPVEVCAGWEGARDRIDAGGTDALQLVVALVDTASDVAGVALVGAGPLEDLVHEHGAALVTEIERLARKHAGFSQALRSVSLSPGALDSCYGTTAGTVDFDVNAADSRVSHESATTLCRMST